MEYFDLLFAFSVAMFALVLVYLREQDGRIAKIEEKLKKEEETRKFVENLFS